MKEKYVFKREININEYYYLKFLILSYNWNFNKLGWIMWRSLWAWFRFFGIYVDFLLVYWFNFIFFLCYFLYCRGWSCGYCILDFLIVYFLLRRERVSLGSLLWVFIFWVVKGILIFFFLFIFGRILFLKILSDMW